MKKEKKKIPSFAQEIEEKSDPFFKIVIPIYIFIIIIANVALIFEKAPWYGILSMEIVLLFLGAFFLMPWWMDKLPERKKKRILQTIENMEEKGNIEYEKFEKTINCTFYGGDFSLPFFWADIFFVVACFMSKMDFSDAAFSDDPIGFVVNVSLGLFCFYFLVINPIVQNKKGKDKIIVDPLNQTFIVRKNILVFFISIRKQIFPWANVKFKIIPRYNSSREIFNTPDKEKLLVFNELPELYRGNKFKIFFSSQFESIIKLDCDYDEYKKIIQSV